MSISAVRLSGVSFSYREHPVLAGASLELAPGEFCVLAGQNGAGKSTLTKIILGELEPDGGSVAVFDRTPTAAIADGLVGYVPQQSPDDYRHIPLTVLELVQSNLNATRILPHRHARERSLALEAIQRAGLAGLHDRLVGELSGGPFQSALLARALVRSPWLLLLDEPTSNLDDANAAALMQTVSQASEGGMSTLLITHDLARLPRLYDRTVVLGHGVIHEESDERSVHNGL